MRLQELRKHRGQVSASYLVPFAVFPPQTRHTELRDYQQNQDALPYVPSVLSILLNTIGSIFYDYFNCLQFHVGL